MAYLVATRRGQLGFTPEQETAILDAQEDQGAILERLAKNADDQERMRTLTIVAAVGGFIYTLARLGELAAQMRRPRTSE